MAAETTVPYGFDIETLLNESQPRSLLVIGPDAGAIVEAYVKQKNFLKQQCRVTHIEDPMTGLEQDLGRHDAGIIIGALEQMVKPAALQLLARLRDLLTRQFCVVVPIDGERPDQTSYWQLNELLGLGLMLLNQYEIDDGLVAIFKYDIATYKKTPDWLNPENWANPELWNKYRW